MTGNFVSLRVVCVQNLVPHMKAHDPHELPKAYFIHITFNKDPRNLSTVNFGKIRREVVVVKRF